MDRFLLIGAGICLVNILLRLGMTKLSGISDYSLSQRTTPSLTDSVGYAVLDETIRYAIFVLLRPVVLHYTFFIGCIDMLDLAIDRRLKFHIGLTLGAFACFVHWLGLVFIAIRPDIFGLLVALGVHLMCNELVRNLRHRLSKQRWETC
ncbi:MAG: hypothetical protein DRG30_09815 [Epsilonproteobacteria bacterium]|nr:MAG: hypothetical protein DRG30_09815 [Campylobacterota bacterium]